MSTCCPFDAPRRWRPGPETDCRGLSGGSAARLHRRLRILILQVSIFVSFLLAHGEHDSGGRMVRYREASWPCQSIQTQLQDYLFTARLFHRPNSPAVTSQQKLYSHFLQPLASGDPTLAWRAQPFLNVIVATSTRYFDQSRLHPSPTNRACRDRKPRFRRQAL
jgi:hypothetical protein